MKEQPKYLSPFPLLEDITSRKNLANTELRVAIQLALFRNSKTCRCNPAQKTIAKKLGLSERTIRSAIAALIQKEVVVSVRPPKWKAATHYFFAYDLLNLNFIVNQTKNGYPELQIALINVHKNQKS